MRVLACALIIITALVLGIIVLFFLPSASWKPTDGQKAHAINVTLQRLFKTGGVVSAFDLIKNNETIILSTENIDPYDIEMNLTFLSQDEIQQKADREGDFLYLHFEPLKVQNSKLVVTLDCTWAVGKDSKVRYLSGGGFTLGFKNIFGKWFVEDMGAWEA